MTENIGVTILLNVGIVIIISTKERDLEEIQAGAEVIHGVGVVADTVTPRRGGLQSLSTRKLGMLRQGQVC